jgi:hypothetical protein
MDQPHLVANAGLLPPAALAKDTEWKHAAVEHLDLGDALGRFLLTLAPLGTNARPSPAVHRPSVPSPVSRYCADSSHPISCPRP